ERQCGTGDPAHRLANHVFGSVKRGRGFRRRPLRVAEPGRAIGDQPRRFEIGAYLGNMAAHVGVIRLFAGGNWFEISVPCYRRWSCGSPRYAIRAEQPSAGKVMPPWAPIVCLPALNHALIVMGWHVEMHEV